VGPGSAELVGYLCGCCRVTEFLRVRSQQWLAVAKADGLDVDFRELTERLACLPAVVVERSEDDAALLLGGDIAGEEGARVGEVQSDAAVCPGAEMTRTASASRTSSSRRGDTVSRMSLSGE
jgi:hypothetical protein